MTKTSAKANHPNPAQFASPSRLNEPSRTREIATLNERLADGLDLQLQLKVAHWNVKGPGFLTLHPLFDALATSVAGFNDALAERAATLGGLALGTARHVAASSRLAEFPQHATRDSEHVALLAERIEAHLEGLRSSRTIAEEEGDIDTADLLTAMVSELEKSAWMLRSSQ